jgi:hypothetical protein
LATIVDGFVTANVIDPASLETWKSIDKPDELSVPWQSPSSV